MSWNQILGILLQLLAESLPEVFDVLLQWLRNRLGAQVSGDASAVTGTLEEFSAAVKAKLRELASNSTGLRRLLLNMLTNRLTDSILQRLYDIVTGKDAPPTAVIGTLSTSAVDALDELDKSS